jgi:putative permease
MTRDADKEDGEDVPLRKRAGPTDFSPPVRDELRRALVWIGAAALLALAVWMAHEILIIFGGIVFAALIDGGARLLGRVLPIGRGWRITIVLLAGLAFLGWFAVFAGNQITAQAAQLPEILNRQWSAILGWLSGWNIELEITQVRDFTERLLGNIGQLTRAVGGIFGAFTTVVLIIVLGIYFVVEPRLYNRGVAWMLPRDRRDHYRETAQIMGSSLRRLLAGRLLGMVIEGVATWLLLAVYGVPMAALLGLLTGLLAFLPNIGALISGALMVLVGFSGGVEMGLYTLFVYVFVQTVDGYVIVPMVARKTVDLPPALVLGAQLIMGVLFGILGLLLADPLMAMLKVWLERQAILNGDEGEDEGDAQAAPI